MKKNVFTRVLAIALVAMSIMAVAIPALAEKNIPVGSYAYTCKGDVALRSSAKIASDNIITRLNTGTQVKILVSTNKSNGFYKVYVKDVSSGAYIREDCLSKTAGSKEYEKRYGTPNYKAGNTYDSFFINVQKDLNLWAKNTIDYTSGNGTPHTIEETYDVFPISTDGSFGPKTKVAVITFQQKKGLSNDGVVGPATKEALYKEYLKNK